MSNPNLLLRRQIELEQDTLSSSAEKYDRDFLESISKGGGGETKEAIIIIKASIDLVEEYIKKLYKNSGLRGHQGLARKVFKQYYSLPRDLAYLVIKQTLTTLLKETNIPMVRFSKELYGSFNLATKALEMKASSPKLYSYVEKKFEKDLGRQNRKKRQLAKKIQLSGIDANTRIILGTFLVDTVSKSGCDILKLYKQKDGTVMVSVSDNVKALLLRSKEFFLSKSMVFKPLLYKPRDWTGLKGTGGYYSYPDDISLIKTRSERDFKILQYDVKPDISRLMSVINKLQQVPYRINKRVLAIINHIDKHKLVDPSCNVLNPYLYGGIPYSEALNAFELIPKDKYGKLDSNNKFLKDEEKYRWLKAIEEQEIRIDRINSKRLAFSLALQLANYYSKEERFYFTYQVDFRSRLYPMQQHLNPQTTGQVKPMLEFANAKPLTPDGVYWLKIHGANCYGYDKLNYEERINEVDNLEEEIKAIHKDPYGTISLWNKADEPLLYLAFCFAYGDYLSDPSSPVSVPVALDATCSGIQIYSGLLKDAKGAKAVNVIDNGTGSPSDIYADVARQVEEDLIMGEYPKELEYSTKDKKRHTTSTHLEVSSIKGKVTRKLTKRNVMTQPYSVTYVGMVQQLKDLLTEYEDDNKVFWKGDKWVVATVLATLNKQAIAKVVQGATLGQELIKEVLSETLKTQKKALWKTPIFKFPVLQRIRVEKRTRLRSPFGNLVLYDTTNEVHYQKMLNGIAPNFIHSLDATLLYRTVEKCQEKDRNDFMLIHDSFAMHPNDIPTMNMMVREAYVEIFKGNPLEDWASQLCEDMVPKVQETMINDLDLDEVLDSPFIFS